MKTIKLLQAALKATRESKFIEFKSSFSPSVPGEWCNLIKDIVAMANSGGGVILVGLENDGTPSGENVQAVLEIDHADWLNKINKYTGSDFTEIEIKEAEKMTKKIAVLEISGADLPFVFQQVGAYETAERKPKTAFAQGTIYFRHGAKSEPGTRNDIRIVIAQQLKTIRKEWISGVRKVVAAPKGSMVSILRGEVIESQSENATQIRLVDDPNAPGYRIISQDVTHPLRQKELINVVNGMLPDGVTINTRDVLAIRKAHTIDENGRFFYKPKFGSPQYSKAFATWIVDQYKKTNSFFTKARQSL